MVGGRYVGGGGGRVVRGCVRGCVRVAREIEIEFPDGCWPLTAYESGTVSGRRLYRPAICVAYGGCVRGHWLTGHCIRGIRQVMVGFG